MRKAIDEMRNRKKDDGGIKKVLDGFASRVLLSSQLFRSLERAAEKFLFCDVLRKP